MQNTKHKNLNIVSFDQNIFENLVITKSANDMTYVNIKPFLFTLSNMVCDVSKLHIGYISTADQLYVFVSTKNKN